MSDLLIHKENKKLKERLKIAECLLDVCANNIHDEGEADSISDQISELFKSWKDEDNE